MTYDEMLEQLKRLTSIVGKAWDKEEGQQRQRLGDELYRNFKRLLPFQWEQIITWLVDHHQKKSLPTVNEFLKAWETVRPDQADKDEPSYRMTPQEHEDWCQQVAYNMSPRASRIVLTLTDKLNLKFSPTVLKMLIDRSSLDGEATEALGPTKIGWDAADPTDKPAAPARECGTERIALPPSDASPLQEVEELPEF